MFFEPLKFVLAPGTRGVATKVWSRGGLVVKLQRTGDVNEGS